MTVHAAKIQRPQQLHYFLIQAPNRSAIYEPQSRFTLQALPSAILKQVIS